MNRKRILDYGIRVGCLPTGPLDKITDVPGVTVGHATVRDARHHTGVTVIMPCEDNMFAKKLTAASFVLNGFGKTAGLVQVDELGTLETPIALTNTLNVGLVHDALVTVMAERCAREHVAMHSINPVVGECNDAQLNAIVDRPFERNMCARPLQTHAETLTKATWARAQARSATGSRAASARLRGRLRFRAERIPSACWCRATTAVWKN